MQGSRTARIPRRVIVRGSAFNASFAPADEPGFFFREKVESREADGCSARDFGVR